MDLACAIDTSVALRLADANVFHVVSQLFSSVVIPQDVLDEIINHRELKEAIASYAAAGRIVITSRASMNAFEAVSYDAAMTAMRPYLSPRPGLRSNIGEMSAVATAIAHSVPIVLMDDGEAETVISRIRGICDQVQIFRSPAVIRAATARRLVPAKTARALTKAWTGMGNAPRPSESGEELLAALRRADCH